jgi:hypothetical protein
VIAAPAHAVAQAFATLIMLGENAMAQLSLALARALAVIVAAGMWLQPHASIAVATSFILCSHGVAGCSTLNVRLGRTSTLLGQALMLLPLVEVLTSKEPLLLSLPFSVGSGQLRVSVSPTTTGVDLQPIIAGMLVNKSGLFTICIILACT